MAGSDPPGISHMREKAALAALVFFEGPVRASHGNAIALLSRSARAISPLRSFTDA